MPFILKDKITHKYSLNNLPTTLSKLRKLESFYIKSKIKRKCIFYTFIGINTN